MKGISIIMFTFWFDPLKCCDFDFVPCAGNLPYKAQMYCSPDIPSKYVMRSSASATLSVNASYPMPRTSEREVYFRVYFFQPGTVFDSPSNSFCRSSHCYSFKLYPNYALQFLLPSPAPPLSSPGGLPALPGSLWPLSSLGLKLLLTIIQSQVWGM